MAREIPHSICGNGVSDATASGARRRRVFGCWGYRLGSQQTFYIGFKGGTATDGICPVRGGV